MKAVVVALFAVLAVASAYTDSPKSAPKYPIFRNEARIARSTGDQKTSETAYVAAPYVAAYPAVSGYSAYSAVPAVSTYSAYSAVPAVGYAAPVAYAAAPYGYYA